MRNAFVLDYQHGRRNVTCNAVISHEIDLNKRGCRYCDLNFGDFRQQVIEKPDHKWPNKRPIPEHSLLQTSRAKQKGGKSSNSFSLLLD